ncbi:hypothetical protein BLNAU_14395 [Blattamonas nauphoetae]|uniref:Uncharacterized protein n=1 Tax=Blattamonas nauphoetae TaxID=2049346 RepID=A0ABQ9XIU3_9EUKA|nr:hypothetical protein BLNAU_14395 [Blattamonas nauphoetae]
MLMLNNLVQRCSPEVRLTLVKADLIPRLISTINPLSLSFAEAADIHTNLMEIVWSSLWLATPYGLASLKIEDGNEQQAVHETVLKQVLSPSEEYIYHLCVNRYSIIDGEQSLNFLAILARLSHVSPFYQPTLDFVVHMPVFLTIPSCLAFFEYDHSIYIFLVIMNTSQRKWNEQGRETRQMWKTVLWMLRMEGFEDVIEEKLHNDRKEYYGRYIVARSIDWNDLLGMNVPEQE